MYGSYVSKSQVDLIGSFGFGKTTVEYAEGMYIHTSDGRTIMDFTGGIGVLNHGHNHPDILSARRKYQEQKRMEVHKNYLSPYIAGLSHNIAALLPDDLNISYFCNSGAEAVEGAIKLAYKYFDGSRKYVAHADISFHGKLLGAAGLTGSPELHFEFPTIPNIVEFEYDNMTSVEEMISKLRHPDGGSDIYALILEPFNASSLRGCSTEFLTAIRDICDENDIVLIFDEVYSGWAKTGELFHFMEHNVVPDIVTMSKSFGGGKASIAGYTSREHIFRQAYDNRTDATLHSTTFNGMGEECVTAMEAIRIVVEDDYVTKSKRIHERLSVGLTTLQEKHPGMIKEIRGAGALNGVILNDELNFAIRKVISFVPGDMFKDPRFAAMLVTGAVIEELYSSHNILTYFGSNREIPLLISPPLIVSDDEIDDFVNALDQTLSLGKLKLLMNFAKQRFLPGGPRMHL